MIARKSNGQSTFSYYNVNDVYTQGIELNSKLKIKKNWLISVGYQYLEAKDKSAIQSFEEGKVFARESPLAPTVILAKEDYFGLPNRSKHMANCKVFYSIPKRKIYETSFAWR